MRFYFFFSLLILTLFGCNETQKKTESAVVLEMGDSIVFNRDSIEILDLIKKVMSWQDSDDQMATLPLKGNDSNVCIGVDYEIQEKNLINLQSSNYFTANFISNYKRIIDRFDEIVKKNEVEKFDIAEMAPFRFATDASPWCNCQESFGWDKIVAKDIKFSENTCFLKWGWNEWKDYLYTVKLKKEKGIWKIDEMEGFDYNLATKIY